MEKQRQRSILIVEDDLSSQKLLKLILRKDDTHFAASIDSARRVLHTHPLDAVIMDLSLQGDEDGLDLVRELRSNPRYQDLPILGLSGHDHPVYSTKAMAEGCDMYLTKPVSPQILLYELNALLNSVHA